MAHARTRLAPLVAAAAVAAGALLTACSNSEEASTLTTTVTPPRATRSVADPSGTAPAPALASATADTLQISGGWVKLPPKKDVTAGYLKLRNAGPAADALVGVTTDVATKAELHTMQPTGNGAEKMVQVNEIPLPPGQEIELRSGGLHLMLVGMKKDLVAGEQVPVELAFASGKKVPLRLPVLSPEQAPRGSQQTPSGGAATPSAGGSGHGGH
ncbi:copper chaperone PCu(A)C [Streptoalloteichus hindustanus]|uniref:Copper(I)-binding protein n=1 Tax=Streptoalloteichus hindustanus TaxID=2017 RepID=A0A1M5K1E9_STRHI|nr:copper chaperone PCu(A)C [Streptoalloteichus hindustanus]SHG46594.1 Copper(I)-binding protein [Streptoalloteichus hindustanus]